jgi:hypothetical protein
MRLTGAACEKAVAVDPIAYSGAAMDQQLLTRSEAMARLRLKSSHFSKVVSGKIRGLPRLPVLQIGRCQFFRRAAIERWIIEAEKK